jgi:hypothetical protein
MVNRYVAYGLHHL